MMGVDSTVIRKVSIAMYEGEINMVIHANGGTIKVLVSDDNIRIILADTGPGIPDVEKPCSRDTLPLRRSSFSWLRRRNGTSQYEEVF